jgi:hypothetical protein
MPNILPNIMTLTQHLFQLKIQSEDYRPQCCEKCGKNKLWCHGFYTRKSNRRSIEFETDDPIMIPRFLCPACQTTCSTLPEVIPPRRHYLWALQQAILLQLLGGASLDEVAKQWPPSLNTIRRWWQQLKSQFTMDESCLRSRFAELGRSPGFTSFWSSCLAKMDLSSAMYHLSTMGRAVP